MNNPYEANPNRVHKTGINTKDDIIFRNQPKESQTQPTQPPDGQPGQPCHRDKNLALTNKHTVEFSNNRHTPTQHHPTGQNLAWGNFSNLPDPRCPFQLGVPSSEGRPWSQQPRTSSGRARHPVDLRGDRPGDQPPSRMIETRCPFLPAGRTSRTLHALRGSAKSAPCRPRGT